MRLGIASEPRREKVAIKVYEKYKLCDAQKKLSVSREIEVLSKLNHPYCIKLYETIDTSKTVIPCKNE